MSSTSSTALSSAPSSSTSGAPDATGSLSGARSVRITTNSWTIVPLFLMWNVTGPAGAVVDVRSISNSDSVASMAVPVALSDALALAMAAAVALGAAADAGGGAEPPPLLLQPTMRTAAVAT